MNLIRLIAVIIVAVYLSSCANDSTRVANAPGTKSAVETKSATEQRSESAAVVGEVLFADPMTSDWQKHWFLDGKEATLEHRADGLYFAGGSITKEQDPVQYHAHHAVLWTRQEFAGDIAIGFDMCRADRSDYGNTLIYIQAQGIGKSPYVEDIFAWNDLRTIPAMDKYFDRMNLLSISLRENVRCKRYPWNDVDKGVPFKGPLIEPMYDYAGIEPGEWYRVEIEKKGFALSLRIVGANDSLLAACSWDTAKNTEDRQPQLIQKGRIGLRHMSTKQFTYKNFSVRRLVASTMHAGIPTGDGR